MPKLLILCERSGDHCNRLFQSIHYHAYCKKNNIIFWNPTLIGMLNKRIALDIGNASNKVLKYISKFLKLIKINKGWQTYPNNKKIIQLVGGWEFRCHELSEEYWDTLRNYYKINRRINEMEEKILEEIKKKKIECIKVVGIHIRRRDYREFKGGKYMYTDAEYKKITEKIKKSYQKKGIKTWIIVCSDEAKILEVGQDKQSQGRWFADQLILQNCDIILGPPSTFTLWASYIAKVKYVHIETVDQEIDIVNAMICIG